MSYKTILVHMQLGQPHAPLLHLAARLGDRFGARLVGVAACEPLQALIADSCANGVLIQDELDELRREMATAEHDFHAALGGHTAGVAWHGSIGGASIADHVAHVARGADLILTDPATGGHSDPRRQLQMSALLMRAGRPVLIAPAPASPLLFAHALVAWDDSRECRRAVTDALPLLRDAQRVSLVQVAPGDGHAALMAQLQDVAAWLHSHGVGAQPLLLPAAGGSPLLGAIALDHVCDLVVAGAYGHSRLREWALGGVTRALAAQQQIAVMLSH
jgi:nucleotide-binding universal stress UspA family protein